MDSGAVFLIVEVFRCVSVLLGALAVARLLAANRRASRLHRTRLRQDAMHVILWLTAGLWLSAAFAIMTNARPGPGWVFYPISWVGYLRAMRLINDVEEADRG
jgi:hypothetical protein